MLASFGTFLSALYGIKLFINLMMAAAAVCELLTEPSCMSLEMFFREKVIYYYYYYFNSQTYQQLPIRQKALLCVGF